VEQSAAKIASLDVIRIGQTPSTRTPDEARGSIKEKRRLAGL
jgi:hypothetical protein